jgi:peroxiredoxin
VAQVVAHHAEIKAAGANVVTVSFGTPYWSQVWLQETKSPYPFLIDPEREAYHAYRLKSSIFSSWSPANLWFYSKAVLHGRETFGKRGDPHQLGGDFIIDQYGIVRLAHPSRDPTDRPSVAKLLANLQTNQAKAIPPK